MHFEYRREEIHTNELEDALNSMGQNGWRVIHLREIIANGKGPTPYFFDTILERQIEEDQEEIGPLLEKEFNKPINPINER